MTNKKDKIIRTNITIRRSHRKLLKWLAYKMDKNMSAIVRFLIEDYIKKNNINLDEL